MRGKDVLTDVETGQVGITPAYAGKRDDTELQSGK